MCLEYLDEKIKVNKNYGWAIFKSRDGKLYPLYQTEDDPIKTNTWMKDEYSYLLLIETAPFGEFGFYAYETGYHLFLYKEDALTFMAEWTVEMGEMLNFELKKVYFRKIVTKGYQFNSKMIVVKERYVLQNS
jgi:hypothetical protein